MLPTPDPAAPTNYPSTLPTHLPTILPTPDSWEKGGCPPAFDESLTTVYAMGEHVAVENLVYECVAPGAVRCRQAGWEPGAGQFWEEAWALAGSCGGSIKPTSSPTREVLPAWENTGCPAEYVANRAYDAGEVVSAYGSYVFECKPWPDQGFCQTFSPEDEVNGALGWTTVGGCGGTIGPTNYPSKMPTYVPTILPTPDIWEKGGCPPAFDESLTTVYAIGEHVAVENLVYECVAPIAARCRQAGWEPGAGQFWEEAWALAGSCGGSIEPTSSPTREALPAWENTGCPEEYVANKDYDAGDVVSAYGSRVFECKPWPEQGFCQLFSPEDEVNGHYGWTIVGGCGGTIAPTGAPTLSPTVICADPAFSTSGEYKGGDRVSFSGEVYECKVFPYSLWCERSEYRPGQQYWVEAWTKKGSC